MGGSVRFGIRLSPSTMATHGSAHHPQVPSPSDSHNSSGCYDKSQQRQFKGRVGLGSQSEGALDGGGEGVAAGGAMVTGMHPGALTLSHLDVTGSRK